MADRNVPAMAKRIFASERFRKLLEESCRKLFAAVEELEPQFKSSEEKISYVQYVLKQVRKA